MKQQPRYQEVFATEFVATISFISKLLSAIETENLIAVRNFESAHRVFACVIAKLRIFKQTISKLKKFDWEMVYTAALQKAATHSPVSWHQR